MTNRTKIVLIIAGTGLVGTGFWLWWRQKDAVPSSAVPILRQAKAVLAGVTATGTVSGTSPDTSTLPTVFPDYIPLPNNTNAV